MLVENKIVLATKALDPNPIKINTISFLNNEDSYSTVYYNCAGSRGNFLYLIDTQFTDSENDDFVMNSASICTSLSIWVLSLMYFLRQFFS